MSRSIAQLTMAMRSLRRSDGGQLVRSVVKASPVFHRCLPAPSGVRRSMKPWRGVLLVKRKLGRALSPLGPSRLLTNALVQLNVRTHRTWALPILLYAPTSRCNSRCASCDYWRTDGAEDLRKDEGAALCRELPALRTKLVVFP